MRFPDLKYFVHDQYLTLMASFFGPLAPCEERLVLYRQHELQQTGGTKTGSLSGLATGRKEDLSVFHERWDFLFSRLEALGADPGKLA